MNYLLAHDLGTSGNKAVLYDESGNFVADHFHSYETCYQPELKVSEQNPRSWWESICACSKRIIEKAGIKNTQIAGVSFSGHMNCMLPVDKDFQPLTDAMIWSDQRSEKEAHYINEALGNKVIYDICGHRINSSYVISKILWLKRNHPSIFSKTHRVFQAKDYIIYKLTDIAVTDFSEASHLGILNIKKKVWSDVILKELGIQKSLLNEPQKATVNIGSVTNKASKECGLSEGTPIIIGGGDGCCATAGAGISQVNSPYNVIGTSSWIAFLKDEPLIDTEMRTFNFIHLDGEKYMPCGTMQSAGFSLSWLLRNILDLDEREIEDTYKSMDEILKRSKDNPNVLLFLPYLLGERSPWWNTNASAVFFGLKSTHRKIDLIRSVLEGVAFNLKMILDIFQEHERIRELKVIGGGAKNQAWMQLLSDIWQVKLELPRYLEQATSIGAIACAGIGLGIFEDFKAVERLNPVEKKIEPSKNKHMKYEETYNLFKKLYKNIEPLYDELYEICISM